MLRRSRYQGIPRFDRYSGFPPPPEFQTDLPSQQTPPMVGYSGKQQPDIVQYYDEEMQQAGRTKSIGDRWKGVDDPKIPKVRFANRSQVIEVANRPQLIIPQNQYRSSFAIGNTTGSVVLASFGFPIPGTGLPIAVNGRESISGYACPIDDIYITCPVAGVILTAYEGAAAHIGAQ